MSTVFVSSHPLVQHKIAGLRDVRTGPAEFRRLVRALCAFARPGSDGRSADDRERGEDPSGAGGDSDLVGRRRDRADPSSRPGHGRWHPRAIPEAEVWHIGLFRDEASLRPTEYYNKFPARPRVTVALLIDPMLATGGSAVRACEIIKAAGVPRLKLVSLIAAPEGIALINRAMPDVSIYVGAVDERLNEVGYIYPGLGDAGDRQFGT